MAYIDEFIKYIQNKNYSNYTISCYEKDLNQYLDFLKENKKNILEVDYKFLRSYLSMLYDKNYAKKTIARHISSLKSFYKFLFKNNIIDKNPMVLIKTPKLDKKLPKFLYYDDIDALLNVPDTSTFLGLRDALILEVLYSTGIRVSELVNIEIKDINFSENTILILGKGNKERYVIYGSKMENLLEKYIKERATFHPNHDYLFVNRYYGKISDRSIRKIIDTNIKKGALNLKISPHTLRHTFATHMLDSGADIEIVKELLGHESLSTTQIYTHVTNESLKRVYDKSHPRAK